MGYRDRREENIQIALQYKHLCDFMKEHRKLYDAARRNGYLRALTQHMIKGKNGCYSKDTIFDLNALNHSEQRVAFVTQMRAVDVPKKGACLLQDYWHTAMEPFDKIAFENAIQKMV